MSEQEEKLRQEILGDARRKAERAIKRARRDAEKTLEAVRAEQDEARGKRLEAATREAEEKYRAVTAGIAYTIRRRWLLQREEVLDKLFAAMLPEIEAGEGIDRARSLRELLREALEAIGPAPVRLRLHPRDIEILDETSRAEVWRAAFGTESSPAMDMDVEPDESIGRGLILESRDGRHMFDNTYATRLTRLRPVLRTELCAGFTADEETSQDD